MLIYSVQSKGGFEMIQVIREKILSHLVNITPDDPPPFDLDIEV